MLGYELKDLEEMRDAVYRASVYLPPNESNDITREGLNKVADFLAGLAAEGHFE